MFRTCKICKSENPAGSVRCSNCNYLFVTSTAATSEPPKRAAGFKSIRAWVGLIAAVVLILLAASWIIMRPSVDARPEPKSVKAGEPVKLIWIAKQASEVSISVISGADSKQELRGLDAVGERIFHPLVSARYTITVKGLFGRTASKVLDVDVESTH